MRRKLCDLRQRPLYLSDAHRKGTCSCEASFNRKSIESRVLAGLKERPVTPELVSIFVREFQDEYARLLAERTSQQSDIERKLNEADRKLKAMTAAIEDGFYQANMKTRMTALVAQKAALTEQTTPQKSTDSDFVHPRLHEIYARKIATLQEMLDGDDADTARELIRSMIEKVTITSGARPEGYSAVLHGELAAILAVGEDA